MFFRWGNFRLTGTADIPEEKLVHSLWQISDNPQANLNKLMHYLQNRAGLLLPRGVKVHSFPHRTFQEYLAACYLTDTDYPDLVAKLSKNDPDRWREVCLLAGAKAARGSSSNIWTLAEELCYKETDDPKVETSDIWGAQLAGQALAETAILDQVSPRNELKLDRVKRWLLRIMEGNQLPARERVKAGNSLSVLGDPRFNPEMWYLPNDEMLGFVKIESGSFIMGSTENHVEAVIKEWK